MTGVPVNQTWTVRVVRHDGSVTFKGIYFGAKDGEAIRREVAAWVDHGYQATIVLEDDPEVAEWWRCVNGVGDSPGRRYFPTTKENNQ
jgi:hypothetical protein